MWLTIAAYVWNADFQRLAATAPPLRTYWQIVEFLVPLIPAKTYERRTKPLAPSTRPRVSSG